MSWQLIEAIQVNGRTWKKHLDSHGNERFQKPDGTFTSQNAWNGAQAHNEPEPVEPDEPDEPTDIGGVTPAPTRIDVSGGVKQYDEGVRFAADVRGVPHARTVLESNSYKWEGFQLEIAYEFECTSESGTVIGYSRVKGGITFTEFQGGNFDPDNGVEWNRRTGDTIDEAEQEALENAWAKVNCSIQWWEKVNVRLIIYTPENSTWNREAENLGKVTV